MNQSTFPLVTFDLGGVIVRISSSIEEAAARSGIELKAAKPDEVRWSRLFVQWQTGRIADEDFFEQWAGCVGRFGVQDAPRLSLGWLQDEFEGIAALLDELSEQGVPLGCLSNTARHHWDFLLAESDRYPSMRYFRHAHASHLIGKMKPDEAIFRAYEELTGFASDRILFFDDLQANVDGAIRCGWRAIRIDPRANPARQMREHLLAHGIGVTSG
jgi:putative hydrolase of the HAD superfamily